MTGTQAVDRAVTLLARVVRADETLAFSALAEETGLPRSTTSRLLAALERNMLLARTGDGSFLAGPLFSEYAAGHDPGRDLGRLADPFLQELAELTGETVHLGVPRGTQVVEVAQVDSRFVLGARDWSQIDVPSHCSAQGKVLMAHGALPVPAEPMDRPTEKSHRSVEALTTELERIGRMGYAVTVDELEEGLSAVAAPVFGSALGRGGVVAALGISGPTARIGSHADQLGRTLVESADSLSRRLRRRATSHKEGAA